MHFTEEELALRAARGDPPGDDGHLVTCPACRARLEFLRGMHAAFLLETSRPPDPRILEGVPDDVSRNVIHLRPFDARVELPNPQQELPAPLFSAQGDRKTGDVQAPARVFASEAHRTMVRVLEEGEGMLRCFVLADEDRKRQRVLLDLVTPSGDRMLMATDEDGMATGEVREPIVWDETTLTLSLPLAVFHLDGPPADSVVLSDGGVTMEAERENERVRVRCSGIPTPRRLLVLFADGETETLEMAGGLAGIPAKPISALRVFS